MDARLTKVNKKDVENSYIVMLLFMGQPRFTRR